MRSLLNLLAAMLAPLFLLSAPVQTDYALFLFDNGDKNMVASMLRYAETSEKSALDKLDFRIVFLGASLDAMDKEPFCHFPDKLIHYAQLGIAETIDHTWKRDRKLSPQSLEALKKNLIIRKKTITGVSSSIFTQVLQIFPKTQTIALRDNPSPYGNTDYFTVAEEVQTAASCIAVPSKLASDAIRDKKIYIVGYGPIDEWKETAEKLDKEAIVARLGLNPHLPIVVYAGVYGDFYKECFEAFLGMLLDEKIQVLIVPHPRFKGVVEKKTCESLQNPYVRIVGEQETDPSYCVKTVEALAIADLVVTADATSTVVFQANVLGKKVLHINGNPSSISDMLCAKHILHKVETRGEFVKHMSQKDASMSAEKNAFEFLGMPQHGAQLLWEAIFADEKVK